MNSTKIEGAEIFYWKMTKVEHEYEQGYFLA